MVLVKFLFLPGLTNCKAAPPGAILMFLLLNSVPMPGWFLFRKRRFDLLVNFKLKQTLRTGQYRRPLSLSLSLSVMKL